MSQSTDPRMIIWKLWESPKSTQSVRSVFGENEPVQWVNSKRYAHIIVSTLANLELMIEEIECDQILLILDKQNLLNQWFTQGELSKIKAQCPSNLIEFSDLRK